MTTVQDAQGNALPAGNVPVMLSCSFDMTALDVVAPLHGSIQRFQIQGVPIEVHLPKAPPGMKLGSGESDDAPISCHNWDTRTQKPILYDIHRVMVFVDLQRTYAIADAALERVSPEFFSATSRAELKGIVAEGQAIAASALTLWIRTLRWKTLNWRIGQIQPARVDRPQQVYLVHGNTRRRFFSGPITIVVPGSIRVRKRAWNACGRALRTGQTPPLWLDFLFEGEHRIASQDLHGGIISLAIACELLIRALVLRPTNRRFVALLRRMKVSNILDQWKDVGPMGKRLNQAMDRDKLTRLLQLRNGIMHSGAVQTLKAPECRDLAKAVRTFVIAGTALGERVS
jgi:hypothetical protein